MAVVFSAVTDRTPGTADSWQNVDETGQSGLPANVAGIFGTYENTSAGSDRAIGVQMGGSTDDDISTCRRDTHTMIAAGVDASDIWEAYIDSTATDLMYRHGWFTDDETVMLSARIDKSLSSTGSWLDIDISADTGGNTAIAAIVEIHATSGFPTFGLRKNGSTDNRTQAQPSHGWHVVGCDASEIFEMNISATTVDCYLVGYITADFEFHTNGIDHSVTSGGSYETKTASAGATGVVCQWHNTGGGALLCAQRKNGDTHDHYQDGSLTTLFTEVDGSRQFEVKGESTSMDCYEIGISKAAGGGGDLSINVSDCPQVDTLFGRSAKN